MPLLLSLASLEATNIDAVHHPHLKDSVNRGGRQEEKGDRVKDIYKGGRDKEIPRDREEGDKEKTQDSEVGDKERTQDREEEYKEKTQDREVGDKERTQDREEEYKEKTQDSEVGDKERTQDREVGDQEKTKNRQKGDKEKTQDKEEGDKERTHDTEGGDKKNSQDKEERDKGRDEDKLKDMEVCVAPAGLDTQVKLLSLAQEERGEAGGGGSVEKVKVTDSKSHTIKRVYTLDEVSYHCDPTSCWIVLWDHVYDVTSFIREHPGGEDIIYEHAGRDATSTFCDVGHSNDALLMIIPYEIGVLVEHEKIYKRQKMKSIGY